MKELFYYSMNVMRKGQSVLFGLMLVSLLSITACQTTQPINHVAYEKKMYWGDAQQVKTFLDSPEAQGTKIWILESYE